MNGSTMLSQWLDASLEKDLIAYFFQNSQNEEIQKIEKSSCSIEKNTNSEKALQKLLLWVIEIVDELEASYQVKQRAIILINKFLSKEALPLDKFQLLGATCIFICTKHDDDKKLTVTHLMYLCANQYRFTDFLDMEFKVLKTLKYKISFILPGDTTRLLITKTVFNVNKDIFHDIDELITYALTNWEIAQYSLNIIAISCLFYFLFYNQNEYVLNCLTNMITQYQIIEIKSLEEFNSIYYSMLTDDQYFLGLAKAHFQNFQSLKSHHIVSTPVQKANQNMEEEKSTMDTLPQNKYSSFLESPSCEVKIKPFNKAGDEMIEEKCEDKTHEEFNDVISSMLANRKI